MKKQNGFTAIIVIYLLIVIPLAIGWVLNIVDIVRSDFSDINGMLVMRIIGVFVAPLGGVLGWV